jgi:hypothetical protein
MAEETVILNFEVDQSKAVKDLERTEKALLNLKDEQRDLTKEYKAGVISQDQYVRQNLKLQQSIAKESTQKRTLNKLIETESNSRNAMRARVASLTQEYNNLNTSTAKGKKRAEELEKELTDLNNTLNKGSKAIGSFKDNIGNYPEAVQEMLNSTKLAGVSLTDLGTKITSLANPVTAAIGLVTALGAAYAASSTGARDLEFAQNKLAAGTSILIERFGRLVGGEGGGGGGQGVFSRFVDTALSVAERQLTFGFFADDLKRISDEAAKAALAMERLRDLEISRAFAAGDAKTDERRAELQRRIRDDEAESLQIRLEAAEKIGPILENSAQRTVTIIQAQIAAIKESTVNYENNREAQLQVAQLTAEISDKEEEITGKLTENVTARKALVELLRIQREETELINRQGGRNVQVSGVTGAREAAAAGSNVDGLSDADALQVRTAQTVEDQILKIREDAYYADLRNKQAIAEAKIEVERQTLAATAQISGEAAELFNQETAAYKILASGQALISTYLSAQKAYESLVGIPVAGPGLAAAAAAIAVAQGLQRVATINGIEFAEGGYTGQGAKYDVAGVVHKGEYVTPKRLVESPAAQPHLHALERMRTGYADGGFVANNSTADANQGLMMLNAIKALPRPYVSVQEIRSVGQRVEAREQQAKI